MMHLLIAVAALQVSSAELDLKERPVTKVVKLLEKMQQELEAEKKADEELYDKLYCWCETVGKDKAAAIEKANKMISGLSTDVQELSAKSMQLTQEIADLKKEIEEADQALRTAEELRRKELAEFTSDEKELLGSINALGDAVTVLSKHHGEGPTAKEFLQVSSSSLGGLKKSLLRITQTGKLRKLITPAQTRTLDAFLATTQPAGYQSYASQSGTIYGVLKQMKETFEKDLSEATKGENQAVADFQALKEAKTAEINAATAQVKQKSEDLANTNEALAQANADLLDTQNKLAADTAFLADLKDRCARTDAEYEERQQTRQDEIVAVGQTIQILTSDEAHDLFGKSMGSVKLGVEGENLGTFLQLGTKHRTVSERQRRMQQAAQALLKAADKTGSLQLRTLARLAQHTELAAFEKVKKAINDMVAELLQQQKDQIAHRDFCIKELDTTTTNKAVKQDELNDLTAFIADAVAKLDTLTKELADLNQQNQEMTTNMKRASEDREAENAEFQQTIAEQRGTQYILQKALDRMKEFYAPKQPELKDQFGNEVVAGLMQNPAQEPGAAVAAPPKGFDDYKKNSGNTGVLGLLQKLINESKAMENDALRGESSAQAAYESFVKDNNKAVKMNNELIAQKTEEKAQTSEAKAQAESDRRQAIKDMEDLNAYEATLHSSCDFTLKNFSKIQEARANEIEALRQAKAILSGADFS